MKNAWDDNTKNNQDEITTAFKKYGVYNDINGKENHLVKLCRFRDCSPPEKNDAPEKNVKKKGKKKKS